MVVRNYHVNPSNIPKNALVTKYYQYSLGVFGCYEFEWLNLCCRFRQEEWVIS